MSYAYTIDQTANLLVVKFWGEIPYSEDSSAVLTILNDLRIKPGIKILVDRTSTWSGKSWPRWVSHESQTWYPPIWIME